MTPSRKSINIALAVYGLLITLFCLVVLIFFHPFSSPDEPRNSSSLREIRSGGYHLINPLLDCFDLHPASVRETKKVEAEIKTYIAQLKQEKKAELVSVLYRDLSNGPGMGINQDSIYSPASLLKVPVLLAALKQAQSDPSFTAQKVTFNARDASHFSANIKGEKHIIAGTAYTIKELMEYMIIYSDNDAQELLTKSITRENYNDVFDELGIDLSKYGAEDNFLSVKEYAAYFRILYNATFLNKNMSEQALSLLSMTKFNEGIVAGVPPGTLVAHKFGERYFEEANIKQLHDCGIVYKAGKPYLLCIMTRGKDFGELSEIISTISRMVYNSIEETK